LRMPLPAFLHPEISSILRTGNLQFGGCQVVQIYKVVGTFYSNISS
jgi:hypothetical protein